MQSLLSHWAGKMSAAQTGAPLRHNAKFARIDPPELATVFLEMSDTCRRFKRWLGNLRNCAHGNSCNYNRENIARAHHPAKKYHNYLKLYAIPHVRRRQRHLEQMTATFHFEQMTATLVATCQLP